MFLLEAILKYLKKDKFTEILNEHEKNTGLNLLENIPLENDIQNEDNKNCEHIFMPIDSTGEILACTKCGELRKKAELKNVNFFQKKS